MYHFVSGYSSEAESGSAEPKATFSACFGPGYMPLHPEVYAGLLGRKMAEHEVTAYLVNTGWTGGPPGVGERFRIADTRAVVKAAIEGALADVDCRTDPIFGFEVPLTVPGIPDSLLDARAAWHDPAAYDTRAEELAGLFAANIRRFADRLPDAVIEAGPHTE
jgi:phosphoenolpyruvate carboxykinase (ATP)